MANEIKVNLVLNGKGESVEKITKIVKDLEGSGAKISGSFNNAFSSSTSQAGLFSKSLGSISLGAGLVGSGIAAAGAVVISVFKTSIAEAANFEKSLIGLNSVAKNLGQDTGRLGQVVLDLTKDGLIPASEAAAGLKNLMASGLSLDQSIKLFNSLKDSAAFNRQGFLSMGEAIVGATQGIKNGNSIMVDNAGITKNLSVMQKEYAASIGTTVGKLTDAQKVQAAYVGISKEAMIFQGDAEKLTKTYSGSVDRLDAAYLKLKVSMGSFITQSKTVQGILSGTADILDRYTEPVAASKEDRLTALRKKLEKLQESGGGAGRTLEDVRTVIGKLEKEIAEANKLSGNELTDDLMGNGRNRQKLAIITKKVQDEKTRLEIESQNKQRENQEKIYKQLLEKYKDFNANKIKELENMQRRELSVAGNNEKLKLAIKENYSKKIVEVQEAETKKKEKIEKDALERQLQLEKKRADALKANRETVNAAFDNPFMRLERGENQSEEDFKLTKKIGRIGGYINAPLQGKEGASNLISSMGAKGAAAIGTAFLGPIAGAAIGEIAGPLIGELSKGPEHVKAMVKEFADAVPDLVVALVEAIPAFIEEVANQTPVIIERLAEKSDEIVMAIVKGMPKAGTALALAMPKAALAFINKLIEGAGDFVQAMIDAINPFANESGGAIGTTGGAFGSGKWDAKRAGTAVLTGGVSEAWNTVSSWFADGGIMTPRGPLPLKAYSEGGIANSPQLAIFGEGRMNEAYVPLPNGRSIPVEMRGQKSSESNSDYLLAEIIRLLRNPTIVTSSLNINNRAFGEIILEMAKSNQRLA